MILNSMLQNSPVFLLALSAVVLLAYGIGILASACLKHLRGG